MSQLPLKERQGILTETCPEFADQFREVLRRHQDHPWRSVTAANVGDDGSSYKVTQQQEWKKADIEKEMVIYKGVRLFSSKSFMDSITVSRKLMENVKLLMDCIEAISNGRAFMCIPILPSTKQTTHHKNTRGNTNEVKSRRTLQNSTNWSYPNWFDPKSGGTVYEWLCAFLEQLLITKYSQQ